MNLSGNLGSVGIMYARHRFGLFPLLAALPLSSALAMESAPYSMPGRAVEVVYDFGVDTSHTDNVGRAQRDSDRLSDQLVTSFGSVTFNRELGAHSGISLKALAEYVKHDEYQRLDHYNLGLGATLRFKPDLAYGAPWYSLGARWTNIEYPDSELRDGNLFDAEAMVGKRLTDRILVKGGLGYSSQYVSGGPSPRVFDTETKSAFLGLDYQFRNLVFYGQYRLQSGDVVSTSTMNPTMSGHYKTYWMDDAIGPDALGNTRYAYRIEGDTQLLDLGVNYAFSRSTALDLALRQVEVDAAGDNRYDAFSAHLGLFFRFK